jgi:hypothetical protein
MLIITSSPKKWKLGAQLIKFYQKTEFSHIAIVKGQLVFQASHGYVNCMHVDTFLEDNKVINKFKIPESAVDMNYVYHQLGKKYSYQQIFQIALKYLTGITIRIKNNKFICSEFVGKALHLDWVDDFTTPKQISDYLEKIGK